MELYRAHNLDVVDTELHGVVRSAPAPIAIISPGNSDLIQVFPFAYYFRGVRKEFPGQTFDPNPSSPLTPSGSLYVDANNALVVRETGVYDPALAAALVHLVLYVYPGAAGPGPAQPLFAVVSIPEYARPYGQALDRAFSFGPQFFEGTGRITKNVSGLQVNAAAGTGFNLFGERTPFGGNAPVSFRVAYRSATPPFYTFVVSPTTTIPLQYDDGDGTPAAIPMARLTIHTLMAELGLVQETAGTSGFFLILGKTLHLTTDLALAALRIAGVDAGPFAGSSLAVPMCSIVIDSLGVSWTLYDARRRLNPSFIQTG